MENKFYIGTKLHDNKLVLALSSQKEDLISILLVTDAEHKNSDLLKLSKELRKEIYNG